MDKHLVREKVLLLDTNKSSEPFYNYLNSLGYQTFTVGNNTTDVLADTNYNFIQLDYSNYEALVDLINNMGIKIIIPGCNDQSYRSCSIINENLELNLNIDPISTNDLINNKLEFRKFCLNNDIPSPSLFNDPNEINCHTIIIKPTDSFSGKGVSKIDYPFDIDLLNNSIKNAIKYSFSNTYIIEEYIEGQLYSFSGFLIENKIADFFIVKEFCVQNKYSVDHSYVDDSLSEKVTSILKSNIEKISEILKLGDGLIHLQFILKKENNLPYFIELTRRCPGDLYSILIEKSTGFQYSKNYINGILKKNYEAKKFQNIKYYLRKSNFFKIGDSLNYSNKGSENDLYFFKKNNYKVKSPIERVSVSFKKYSSDNELIVIKS